MKIVNLETFRSLPEGIVFMKYEPEVFGELQVKGETWEVDFLCASLTNEVDSDSSDHPDSLLEDALINGSSVKLDFNCYSRDGLFEDNQLFAVYEKQDVEGLIGKLSECLGAYVQLPTASNE